MALDHHQRDLFEALVRGEPMLTACAHPPTTNRVAFLRLARIDHLGVVGMTSRAAHCCPRLVDDLRKRDRLRDLDLGTAVGLDQRIDVVGERHVSMEPLADGPQRVARLGDVEVSRCRGKHSG